MIKFLDIPPVWALLTAVLLWVLATFVPIYSIDIPMAAYAISASLGVALILWSALWFFRKKTTIEPRRLPTTLIVEGPYRINRNPIYSGMFLILLGFALWLGDIIAIISLWIFPFIITRRFILAEEAQLRRSFGPAADAYLNKTRRW